MQHNTNAFLYFQSRRQTPFFTVTSRHTHFPQQQTTTFVCLCVFLSFWVKVWPLAFQQKAQRSRQKHEWRDGHGAWWIELCWEKCPGKREEEWGHYLCPHLWPQVHTHRQSETLTLISSTAAAALPRFFTNRLFFLSDSAVPDSASSSDYCLKIGPETSSILTLHHLRLKVDPTMKLHSDLCSSQTVYTTAYPLPHPHYCSTLPPLLLQCPCFTAESPELTATEPWSPLPPPPPLHLPSLPHFHRAGRASRGSGAEKLPVIEGRFFMRL